MTFSIYDAASPIFLRGLTNLSGWLDKASDEASGREAFDLIGKPYRRSDLARKLRGALSVGAEAA